jgi:hypothetical protein
MDNCVLCANDVGRGGGYSTTRVSGVILRPLCLDCSNLCDKDPKRVAEEHHGLIEKMVAEQRELLSARVVPVETTRVVPQRSTREQGLIRRYDDAYLVSGVTIGIVPPLRSSASYQQC